MFEQQVSPAQGIPIKTTEPAAWQHRALERYFDAIGFEAGIPLQLVLSEASAQYFGQTLLELKQHRKFVFGTQFDEVAEQLYRCSQTRRFTLARMYTLVARALGYQTYVDARQAQHRGAGNIPIASDTGDVWLLQFAPTQL